MIKEDTSINIMFLQIGLFNIALVLITLFQIHDERKKNRDNLLFYRLLLACLGILIVDTIGWMIDGKPIGGQVWITTVIDGFDLILTTTVCWCWVQYSLAIIDEEKQNNRKWYNDFTTILLFLQIIIVSFSQIFNFYYYVDASGVYHRSTGYVIHTILSLFLLGYSSARCLLSYMKESNPKKKKELMYVGAIIFIPIIGNIFQLFVYGYPTVWICMVFMIISVYIHIQNKRVEEERLLQNKALQEALDEAQRANKAKSQFLSNMSHEIRTPMNAIIGMEKLAEDELNDNPTALNYVKEIGASSNYLLGVLNDILEMSRIESGNFKLNPKWVPGLQVFQTCISMIEPSMKEKGIQFEHIQIDNERNKNRFDLYLDDLRMKEILMNLLNNAWKFTPPGGQVSITLKNVSHSEGCNTSSIIISDTGCGMSKEFMKHVFEPFSQERNQYSNAIKGTGLGLPIALQYAKEMGGTITVDSVIGKGSTFTVTLPFKYRPTQFNEKTELKQDKQFNLKGVHVLLAEDHPLNATIAIKLLEKQGIIVDHAENGIIALEKFAKSAPYSYNAILMDIRMPELDGLETTKRIRKLGRKDAATIPIIAMTANAYEDDIQKSFDAGMSDHLSKPIQPALLYETIAKYIQK